MRTILVTHIRIACAFAAATLWVLPAPAAEEFSDANIRSSIQQLASDEFGGRGPATMGEKLATQFIADRFRSYGLAAANHGSYFQEVPMLQITADPHVTLTIQGSTSFDLHYGDDMIVSSPRPQSTVQLNASSMVFVGYGIVAPEYHWNDYAGVDVHGKTVVVLVNDPGSVGADPQLFQGKAMTYYGRWTYKYEEAARQGAAAVLIVHQTEYAGYPWEVVHNSWAGALEELPPGRSYQLAVRGWITRESAARLFAAAGTTLESAASAAAHPGFKPMELHLSASLTLHDTVKSIRSRNVVAMVRGSTRPAEAVIYSAHWDHFGTKPGADGKPEIFHGAIDNASGVAALLELARTFAASKPAPKRTVLFVATTSEEQGLLGAAYYVRHPLVPLGKTVADLNFDVMNMYGRTHDLTVRGQFMSTLDEALQKSAAADGLKLLPDAEPEKGHYFRADHFEFAKAGVPALSIDGGVDYEGRSADWGLKMRADYTAHRYHKPADVYDPDWNLDGMRQQLQVYYRTGRSLADTDVWPTWYENSPFRAVRTGEKK